MNDLKKKIFSVLLLIILGATSPAQNQKYYFKTYTTENGLTYNYVSRITRDKSGFLWIATFDGLNRFDGYEFKTYYHKVNDSNSLAQNFIQDIVVDRHNNLWIVGASCILQKYDRGKDNFITYKNNKEPFGRSIRITLDRSGNLWSLTENGVARFDDAQNLFIYYPFDHTSLLRNQILNRIFSDICIDENGIIWVNFNNENVNKFKLHPSSGHEIIASLLDTFRISGLSVINNFRATNFSYKCSIHISRSKQIWLSSNTGLFLLDSLSKTFIPYKKQLDKNDFNRADTIIWSTFYDGLHIFIPLTGQELRIGNSPQSIFDSFLLDNQGIIWYGQCNIHSGGGTGLTKTISTGNFFTNILLENLQNTNEKYSVFCVYKDKSGKVWIGTRELNYFLCLENGKLRKEIFIDDKSRKQGGRPESIIEDKNGNLWIGYYSDLLLKYDKERKKLTKYDHHNFFPEEFTYLQEFKHIINITGNKIFILGDKGYCLFDPGKIQLIGNHEFKKYELTPAAFVDNQGHYWFGRESGLFCLQDVNADPEVILGNGQPIPSIESFIEGDRDDLWMTTFGDGICTLNKNTKIQFKRFTTEEGLSDNMSYQILKDHAGILWISTNKGISTLNPQTQQFINFDMKDGLLIEEFNAHAGYAADDGEMLFGGMGGIVRFYPDSLVKMEKLGAQPLLITDFKVSGVSRLFDSAVYSKRKIILGKGSDNFSITFACLDFKNSDKLHYRYCLKGDNENWTLTDAKHRFINYTNLQPGKYICSIEASDIRGEWTQKANVTIVIPAFYYQTLLFKAGLFLFILIIILSLILFYIHQIRLSERKKQELLRMESLRNQLNPHFIFNALNPLNYFISNLDKISANQYLTDFSRLMRAFLSNSKYDFIPLEKETDCLEKYLLLQKSRYGDTFNYRIVIPEILKESDILVAPSMIQPFVENAIVHGFNKMKNDRKGFIKISLSQSNPKSLVCIVEDDGIGRTISQERKTSEKKEHKSQGISIIQDRLELFNRINKSSLTITVEDAFPERQETGTKVMIPLPVKKV